MREKIAVVHVSGEVVLFVMGELVSKYFRFVALIYLVWVVL